MLTVLDFDNSDSKVMARLLEMYPVDLLKETYGESGYSADVIEKIVKQNTIRDLKQDALRLMGHCRQHIFVFAHKLKKLPSKIITQHVEHEELVKDEPEYKEIEYLIRATYNFVEIRGESAIPRRSFSWWPAKIVIDPKYLRVHITIAERLNKSSGDFLFRSRNMDEAGIIGGIAGALNPDATLLPADLNRGLKFIWEHDVIDSKFVTRKAARSVDTSLMDAGFTFKKDDPKRYSELVADPLRKSVFHVLNDSTLPETFAIDAGQGFFAFRSFSKTPDGIDKLVSRVLKAN